MPSGQIPPGEDGVTEVKVTSYPGQSTGWAAMSKDVREFDEEKVQNYKDDVDTLLVFAGLFSAILSAFLVAAYPNLQPSPMAIMNYNLERIAMQTSSYNFTDGKLISTTSLPISPPPFQASPEDIRVNILWFSSLILSLMTASFGMLVKQWLREFLAVEVPSPQARLRIRHFREPQLHTWKVFEIVACLPLLLQLSLGLFFVGLCYFTSSVHKSVGHTTFPLVVGWALFFFGATALPIFLPRCPYRTTLLKTGIAHLHHKLSSLALKRLQKLPSEEQLVKDASSDVEILKSVDAIQANDDMLETTFREALQYIHPKPPYKEIVTFILEVLSHRLPTLPVVERALPGWPFDGFAPLDSLRPQARAAVSNIIADHASSIEHFIPYRRPDFAARSGAEQQKFTSIYGLTLVLSIFASDQDAKLSSDIPSSVRSCLEETAGSAIIQDVLLLTTCKGKKNIWTEGSKLLTALTRIWKLTKPKSTLKCGTRSFEAIQSELAKLQQRPDEDFAWNSWSWPEDAPREFQSTCVQYLCTVATAAPEHLNLQDYETQKMLRNILACSSRLIRTHTSRSQSLDTERSFQQLIAFAMKSKLTANMVITCWMSANDAWKKEHDQNMIRGVVRYSYDLPQSLVFRDLAALSAVITEQLSRCLQNLTQSLKLCYHTIYLLLLLQAKTAGVEKCRELFVPIISQIQSLSPGQVTEQSREGLQTNTSTQEDHEQAGRASKLAKTCLDLMAHEQGLGYYSYTYWKEHFHEDNSIFPDELVETLGKLIIRQDDDELYRLRELEERRQESKSAEASHVGVQSDDKGKNISVPTSGVDGSDQEDSSDNKTMKIDSNREELAGLAAGDGGSVGLEKVTGIEDVHAAENAMKALHSQSSEEAPSRIASTHDALASAPVHTQDEISPAPNEEAKDVEATASHPPETSGLMAPHDNTQAGESSGSGQGPTTENGAGSVSALTDEEVARNDGN